MHKYMVFSLFQINRYLSRDIYTTHALRLDATKLLFGSLWISVPVTVYGEPLGALSCQSECNSFLKNSHVKPWKHQ